MAPDFSTQALSGAWRPIVDAFLASEAGRAVRETVCERSAQGVEIFPPHPFRALELTPLESVRVVILGQDPYHTPGKAEGLAFSVPEGEKMPPSLRNIFKEIALETGHPARRTTSLVDWARQGVLLLNTSFTVEAGRPMSHARLGWGRLADDILSHVSREADRTVFLLWGRPAQEKRVLVDETRHAVLASSHPSPLSATRGPDAFIGSGQFLQTNRILEGWGRGSIDWEGAAQTSLFD